MKAWLVLFVLLFVLAQFGLWVKNFIAPLPWYIFGGILLAIASNYEKAITDFMNSQINRVFKGNSHE
ncbi:hypothetical protein A5482_007105 [Cyanobacterium sp. IPPAS B-1200]|uniref:hypothetical protein n=1 Tax=Cyanobacterium sp. IPPAS B-1200 TaxID=1562720 RepID=UPI0008525D0A|nr:hypothetical protein [Cyanobacterium sp. IPPAS B-1200]OEJ79691.1 hypothetical protein A5482_09335 [Cyanobacterium sp. IPPAS B-1200]